MSVVLTKSERKSLKDKLDSYVGAENVSIEDVVASLSSSMAKIKPRNRIQNRCIESCTKILAKLRKEDSPDKELKKAACYVADFFRNLTDESDWIAPAFIAADAVIGQNERTFEHTENAQNILLTDEIIKAEQLLLDFSELDCNLEELLHYSRLQIKELNKGDPIRAVQRFVRDLRILNKTLENESSSKEQKDWAKGALLYLREVDDAVPDTHGLIGIVDDMYVASVAVHFISSHIASIDKLIEKTKSSWPFLSEITFEYKEEPYVLSDMSFCHAALVCSDVASYKNTLLVMPNPKNASAQLVAFAYLGAMWKISKQEAGNGIELKIGHKYSIDKTTVAVFEEVDETYGYKFKGVKKNKEFFGYVPKEQLHRIAKAPQDKKLSGDIPYVQSQDSLPSIYESIFGSKVDMSARRGKRIWWVTEKNKSQDFLDNTYIEGLSLKQIFAAGEIKKNGEFESYGYASGVEDAMLVCVSDLDVANNYIRKQKGTGNDIIIIDATGNNANRNSAIRGLSGLHCKTVVVLSEQKACESPFVEDESFGIWEWNSTDLQAMSINSENINHWQNNPISEMELKTLRGVELFEKTHYITVYDENITKASAIYEEIKKIASKGNFYFEEIQEKTLNIYLKLMRSSLPVSAIGDVGENLSRIRRQTENSLEVDEREKDLILSWVEHLREWIKFSDIDSHPKVISAREINNKRRILADGSDAPKDFRTFSKLFEMKTGREVVMTYWPNSRNAWKLFSESLPRVLHWVLSDIEMKWLKSFERNRNKEREFRYSENARSRLFKDEYRWDKWVESCDEEKIKISETTNLNAIEDLDFDYGVAALRHIERSARGAGGDELIQAKIVRFEHGGFVCYANESKIYRLASEKDHLEVLNVEQLNLGDVLIVNLGSSRDLISSYVEKTINYATLEMSRMWHKALKSYMEHSRSNISDIQRRLKTLGCERTEATISSWVYSEETIGPKEYRSGDLEAIIKLTQDESLKENTASVVAAISNVKKEHMRTAKMLFEKAVSKMNNLDYESLSFNQPIKVDENILLAKVAHISQKQSIIHKKNINSCYSL